MIQEQATQSAAWEKSAVPQAEYDQIAQALTSADSPVGIDAKHTHILILHALDLSKSALPLWSSGLKAALGEEARRRG